MTEKLVTIARFSDSIEADLAKQRLADFGIEAILAGEHASNVYAGLPALTMELKVVESQADRARQILNTKEEAQ